MEISEAISLLQNGHFSQQSPAQWTDLGCGSGLFTFALAQLLSAGSTIYAVDKDPVNFGAWLQPEGVQIRSLQLDFEMDELPFQNLDGILMANSLHYVRDRPLLLRKLTGVLKPRGSFLIVEYDTDTPVQQWVPYPVSFGSLKRLFEDASYTTIHKLGDRPSVFGRARMYAALVSL